MVDNNRGKANQPIKFKATLRNTILDVMRSRGWKETDSDLDWNFYWTDVAWMREGFDHVRLDDSMHINHFRNHYELTRKDLMVKNFKRMKRALEREDRLDEASKFDFFPATFSLPADWTMFDMEFKRNPNAVWIMKPPAKAQGKGIFLFSKMSQISEWRKDYKFKTVNERKEEQQAGTGPEPYLAQRYIDNPHLIGGKKYDLRIYVLVTSFSPLTVWQHRSGFARFCHSRFSMDDIDNSFVHLTNVAVQKTNPKYAPQNGCKWGIRSLRQYLNASVGEAASNQAFADVQSMILRTLQSVQRIMMNDKHCAEMYGYDVMFDNELKPILIETNASPSLTAETPADYHMKFNVIEDYFNVIDLERRRSGEEVRVGGFDLIWKNGPVGVTMNDPSATNVLSYLGCLNEFEIPLSRMTLPPKMAAIATSNNERLLT